ncbi:EamA family transporter [Spongiactinospora gelatinilytica]|uniref:EamA family transporter n=1 Tax=Spongiactinospora gelatinilytica TaxID=2666298 RepID=A0A2W2GCI1_9ACTN|nr:EamA family transporter [Spongiactinospora gelatinilytica]PZG37985.1 EamA family transporter [Spongiactinospora gelatinilytica]
MGSVDAVRRKSLLIWGALAIVYVVWGSTYLGIAVMIETIPPLLGAALRFLAAGLLLGAFLLVRKQGAFRMSARQFGGAALVGVLLLTGGNGMVSVAEQYISSGLAALLVASVPLWLVIFRVLVRDRPNLMTFAGVLVGFAGVAALSLTGGTGGSSTQGVVIILVASLSWSIGSFLAARMPMPPNPFAASTVEMLVGGLVLTVGGLISGERLQLAEISSRSWAGLAYMVLVGSLIGFTSYAWLLGNAPISLVSTYAYVNPVVAVLLGAIVLGESVTTQVVLGGLVIVAGVALVVSSSGRRRRPAEPADEPQLTSGRT